VWADPGEPNDGRAPRESWANINNSSKKKRAYRKRNWASFGERLKMKGKINTAAHRREKFKDRHFNKHSWERERERAREKSSRENT
jgi:hypothetical protein